MCRSIHCKTLGGVQHSVTYTMCTDGECSHDVEKYYHNNPYSLVIISHIFSTKKFQWCYIKYCNFIINVRFSYLKLCTLGQIVCELSLHFDSLYSYHITGNFESFIYENFENHDDFQKYIFETTKL